MKGLRPFSPVTAVWSSRAPWSDRLDSRPLPPLTDRDLGPHNRNKTAADPGAAHFPRAKPAEDRGAANFCKQNQRQSRGAADFRKRKPAADQGAANFCKQNQRKTGEPPISARQLVELGQGGGKTCLTVRTATAWACIGAACRRFGSGAA